MAPQLLSTHVPWHGASNKLSSGLPAAGKHYVQSSALGLCPTPMNVSARVGGEGTGKGRPVRENGRKLI